ncbi:MAG: ferritin-like domain-containing protein [Chloroflexota bacterium]
MSTKEELIKGLNEDLAAELGTVIRYTYQSSKATGFAGFELREILETEIQDELGHAAYLMDIIVDLGGEPTTEPQTFEKPDGLKAMLQLDMDMEEQDVENYKAHAAIAEELGMVDIQMRLEDMAADEAGHARELRRLLKGL